MGWVRPIVGKGAQILHLYQIVPRAGRMARKAALRAFEVQKFIRLVGALIYRGTAILREPNRL